MKKSAASVNPNVDKGGVLRHMVLLLVLLHLSRSNTYIIIYRADLKSCERKGESSFPKGIYFL